MRLISVNDMVRWVRDTGAQPIIAGMIDALEEDFKRWEVFDKRPRVASHSPIGVIELMPTSDGEMYGFKYVNGHPSNPSRGLQTVTAFGVLADVMSGYPLMIAEMTVLTALRTAAMSGLATRVLAREDAKKLGMIGAGSQSEFQALAMLAVRPIEEICVYDVDPKASEKLRANLAPMGIDIQIKDNPRDAVDGADIIITCTADKRNANVLIDQWVPAGVHINGLGGDCPGKTELESEILDRGPVFVEHTEQTRIEGEIQQKDPDFPVTELWKVITGQAPGRESAEQVTIFDSVGFAIEDFMALRYVDQAVQGTDYVKSIDLIADPQDPKDLFGMVVPVPVG